MPLRKRLLFVTLATVALLGAFPAVPGSVVQTLAVTAIVEPSAAVSFEVVAQPQVITRHDLERGYVDVIAKSRLRVRGANGSDTPPQMVLAMEPRHDLFKSVTVAAMDAGADRGVASHHAVDSTNGIEGRVAEFRYRFQLANAAKPGGFGTAISVSVDL